MKRYLFCCLISSFFLAGCFQVSNNPGDDLQTMPVTNNPNIIPSHSPKTPG